MKNGTILQQNSTHKAVVSERGIDIISKGLDLPADEFGPAMSFPERKLYSIPLENRDDLFAIFEDLDETNRYNLAEANAEFGF